VVLYQAELHSDKGRRPIQERLSGRKARFGRFF
jgi:hypothetical protein